MKMLFIHDNRFWKKGETYYSYGHFAYNLLWKRYLRYFDEITVGGRIEETDEEGIETRFSVSNGDNVSFFALPDLMSFSGLKQIKTAKERIAEEMKKADCTVIRLPSNLGYLACHVARKLKVNYVVEVVGCTWDDLWNYGTIKGKLYAPFSFLFEKKCVKKAENILYVSRRFLQNRYPNKHFNMGCSDTNISTAGISVLEKRVDRIRNIKNAPEIRIGLIASLNVGYKGHDTALLALKEVLPKHKNLKLAFLGDGDKTKWENMAKRLGVIDRVEFSGALPGGEAVLNWIDNIDIFVMPSLQETLGRALIEAMSRGCPCIGGAGTAVPEQLPDDCIHKRKDYKELGDMICYMIENPQYTELCAVENYQRSKKYSEEVLTARRDYFWNKVLKK